MMNIQELGTIKRAKTPIKIILLDNQRFRHGKTMANAVFPSSSINTILDDNPDFITLASAFETR